MKISWVLLKLHLTGSEKLIHPSKQTNKNKTTQQVEIWIYAA